MEKEDLIKLLMKSNLKELVEKNINPNKIVKELNLSQNITLQYYFIKKYIEQNFKKAWNAKEKRWVEFISKETGNARRKSKKKFIPLPSQISIEMDKDPTNSTESTQENRLNVSQTMDEKENKTSNTEETSKKNATNEEVLSLLNTLEKRTSILEGQLSEIINSTKAEDRKATRLDANDNSLADIDEVIKLYTGKKNKRSVNINIELKDKIIQLIYNKYGISDNESLAINIALLLALYKK